MCKSFLDWIANLLKLANFNDLAIANNLGETTVSLALLLPNLRSRPLIDESEYLQKEDSEVVWLYCCATVNRWHNRFKELCQGMQYVKVWNSVVMQGTEKVEGEQTILSWEHQPWIDAVLYENSAQVYQVFVCDLLKTLLKFAF